MDKLKERIFEIDKLIILVSFFCLFVDSEKFWAFFSFYDGLGIKLFVFFQIYVFRDELVWCFVNIFNYLPIFKIEFDEKGGSGTTIDGIDSWKLVDYMFESWKFAYNDMVELFSITPQVYKKLWDSLENAWVLERGKNNSRIMRNIISKSDLFEWLSKFRKSCDITPLLKWSGTTAKVI